MSGSWVSANDASIRVIIGPIIRQWTIAIPHRLLFFRTVSMNVPSARRWEDPMYMNGNARCADSQMYMLPTKHSVVETRPGYKAYRGCAIGISRKPDSMR